MRALLLGDGVALNTGFAQVLRRIATALVAAGHDVWQIAALDLPPKCDSRPYHALGVMPRFPTADALGISVLADVMEEAQPDVVVLNGDPGTIWTWQERALFRYQIPTVVYAPVEGAPVHSYLAQAFRRATKALTYTKWAHDRLLEQHSLDVPWVYHGVDTATFRPLTPTERADTREALGWTDSFITAYVARNNGRKGHDRLLKALLGLPEHHRLYLHCLPYDGFELGGWDLGFLTEYWHLQDRVQFSEQATATDGLPAVSLARRLGAADLYVSASQVEGFGLPLLEAMAVGLPVICPDDRGNQAEVVGDGCYTLLPVRDWATWHTAAQLANVHPRHIAEAILHAEQHSEERELASARARARATLPEFSWEPLQRAVLQAVEEAVGAREKVAV